MSIKQIDTHMKLQELLIEALYIKVIQESLDNST